VIAGNPPVRILVHPEAIKVAYKTVRELVPKLWDGRRIDYAVHIGMASGRRFYSVERRGHRDGYGMEDVDQKLLEDHARKAIEGEKWIWHGLPDDLLSSVDVDDVWRRWRIALPVRLVCCKKKHTLTEDRQPMSGFLRMPADTFATSYTTQVWHT
jgi:pyroglutamyl-peptidase